MCRRHNTGKSKYHINIRKPERRRDGHVLMKKQTTQSNFVTYTWSGPVWFRLANALLSICEFDCNVTR